MPQMHSKQLMQASFFTLLAREILGFQIPPLNFNFSQKYSEKYLPKNCLHDKLAISLLFHGFSANLDVSPLITNFSVLAKCQIIQFDGLKSFWTFGEILQAKNTLAF